MAKQLRVGVIGVGAMGRNHLRVLHALDGVDVAAVYDPLVDQRWGGGVEASGDLDEFVGRVDAAVVAAPTEDHLDVGLRLVKADIHVLIEKPLADNVESARELVDAAAAAGVVLAVGHVERFNPAVRALKARLAAGELGHLYQVTTERQGPFPARIKDVGVVKDLASHDIDLTRFASGSEYASISAQVAHRAGRPHEDLVSAVGLLDDGTVVSHLVNWLTPTKERRVAVTGEKGRFVADTLSADLYFYENGVVDTEWDRVSQFRGVSEGNVVRFAIPKPEPLRTELEGFRDRILDGTGEIVTGEEGLKVLEVAEAMLLSAARGSVEEVP